MWDITENCTGLVDEDPSSVQPLYLKKLQERENLSDCGVKILKDNAKNNDLIILCPRLEEWVLKATKEADLDISRYNLPDDGDQLHKVINIDLRKFETLIKDLKGKSEMVKALENSVKELEMK